MGVGGQQGNMKQGKSCKSFPLSQPKELVGVQCSLQRLVLSMTMVGGGGKMITVVVAASLWLCHYNIG